MLQTSTKCQALAYSVHKKSMDECRGGIPTAIYCGQLKGACSTRPLRAGRGPWSLIAVSRLGPQCRHDREDPNLHSSGGGEPLSYEYGVRSTAYLLYLRLSATFGGAQRKREQQNSDGLSRGGRRPSWAGKQFSRHCMRSARVSPLHRFTPAIGATAVKPSRHERAWVCFKLRVG